MKTSIAFLASSAALVLAFASCGGSNDTTVQSASNDAGPDASPSPTKDAAIDSGTPIGGGTGGDAAVVVPDIDAGDSGLTVGDDLATKVLGTFALRQIVATITDLPVLGKSPSTSTSYGVATIARDGSGLTITQVGCHVDASSGGGVTTTIPDAIAKSVPPAVDTFRVWQDGADVKFARLGNAIAIGVKLVDVENDPLPTASSDPRVWDQDGDGQPGVTVKISGLASGDIYVVQRQKSAFEGTLAADGSMSGLVVDKSAQSTIGSTNPILNTNIAQTPDDPSKSTVRLVKIDASYDCAKLMSAVPQLFP